jgi:C1A family cysteine protease
MSVPHKFGWIPDLPDSRDYPYSRYFKIPKKLPSLVDLRYKCSEVEDQGILGSCTAQALIGAMEYLDEHKLDMSKLFLYFNERVLEGTVNYDSGAMIRDGVKSLNKQGVCTEALWPYNILMFKKKPTDECYTEAEKHQIISYLRLYDLQEIKACLAEGYPVTFGFSVYESFDETEETGQTPMPSPGERVIGGHAVLAVGYDDSKQCLIVRNSWGKNWGLNGYFYLPYDYITPEYSEDYWTIREIEDCGEYKPNWWQRFINWLKQLFS